MADSIEYMRRTRQCEHELQGATLEELIAMRGGRVARALYAVKQAVGGAFASNWGGDTIIGSPSEAAREMLIRQREGETPMPRIDTGI